MPTNNEIPNQVSCFIWLLDMIKKEESVLRYSTEKIADKPIKTSNKYNIKVIPSTLRNTLLGLLTYKNLKIISCVFQSID